MPSQSYLIIGAGCFGASTAYALRKTQPTAIITLVDRTPFPNPAAAAHDLNKIIRAEYEDPLYMRLALEAQEVWRSDPLFKPFFHETGIVFAGGEESANRIVGAYESVLGEGRSPAVLMEMGRVRGGFGGVFRDAEWDGVRVCTFNPGAGWGDAEGALGSVIQTAVEMGVRYVEATVRRVVFDSEGVCSGVVTADGARLEAETVILCAGAYTPWLLAESAPGQPDVHVGERMVAAASVMCSFRVPDDQKGKLMAAPIIVHALGEYPAECIPASREGLIKCTHERSFTHKIYHEGSEQFISVPPAKISQQTWSQDVPQGLKDEIAAVRRKLFGSWIENMEPVEYRMCWDAITPNQDWIMSAHPHVKNLYVVGGGSFHAWKFLPNVGQYVVQMLQGSLDEELAGRWAWDRNNEGANCASYLPARDLKDVPGYVGETGRRTWGEVARDVVQWVLRGFSGKQVE